MSAEITRSRATTRRTSVYVDSFRHSNPIPAASRIDNIIYSSVINGLDRSRAEETQTLEEQAQRMFARLRDIVEAAGATIEDVVKVTIWMRNRADREAINRFWIEMFPDAESRPARHTADAKLDGEQLIQCDFIAVTDRSERGVRRS